MGRWTWEDASYAATSASLHPFIAGISTKCDKLKYYTYPFFYKIETHARYRSLNQATLFDLSKGSQTALLFYSIFIFCFNSVFAIYFKSKRSIDSDIFHLELPAINIFNFLASALKHLN